MKTLRTPQHRALADELRKLRKEQVVTQAELAKRLNVQQSYVAKVEGLERRLDVVEFIRWLDALESKEHASDILNQIASVS